MLFTAFIKQKPRYTYLIALLVMVIFMRSQCISILADPVAYFTLVGWMVNVFGFHVLIHVTLAIPHVATVLTKPAGSSRYLFYFAKDLLLKDGV